MADLSSVDAAIDEARAAFDASIDEILAAVTAAVDQIHQQIERLEAVLAALDTKRAAVRSEIDALADRAAELEALALPAPVSAGVVYDDELVEYVDEHGNPVEFDHESDVVVAYVDADGNPVDEHGTPIEGVERAAGRSWADLDLPRTERLVVLVEAHDEITAAEAVEALAAIGDEVSISTVSASLGNLARQGRITKLGAGTFGPA